MTVTVSVSVFPIESVTVRVKVSAASPLRPVGAVNLAVAVSAPVSVTAGVPPVCSQA